MTAPRFPCQIRQQTSTSIHRIFPKSPAWAFPTLGPRQLETRDASLSQVFDRIWAKSIMVEAAPLRKRRALEFGAEALQRIELLRLRSAENLPIRAIAESWEVDPAKLRHAYALARQDFCAALLGVVAFHSLGNTAKVEAEVVELLRALS